MTFACALKCALKPYNCVWTISVTEENMKQKLWQAKIVDPGTEVIKRYPWNKLEVDTTIKVNKGPKKLLSRTDDRSSGDIGRIMLYVTIPKANHKAP